MSARLGGCPSCGKQVPLTRRGKIWGHTPPASHLEAVARDGNCTGSGQPPKETPVSTTRHIPSPAEIREGLAERTTHGLTGLVHWEQARTSVRLLFRTTPARAAEWLDAAVDGSGLRAVYVSGHGHVSVVYTDADGKDWRGTPSQSGFGNSESDSHFKAVGLRPGMYVATTAVLDAMSAVAQQAAKSALERYRAKEDADTAGLRERHGDSIDVLQALLKAVPLDPSDRKNGVRLYTDAGRPDDPIANYDSVHIMLTGTAIDAVAAVLRERGITL